MCTGVHPSATRLRRAGFSLLELMVAVAIAAVLLAVAAPAFNQATLSSRLSAEASRLSASTRLARGEAIKRNTNITLCVSANGSSCQTGGWEQGWIVLAGTTLLHQEPAASRAVRVTEADHKTSLTFDATGAGATAASFTICSADSGANQEQVLTINAAGRVAQRKTQTGTCPT